MDKKKLLYLRTDSLDKPLIAGGSVSHTLGVIDGFFKNNYDITCASSVMHDHLKSLPFQHFIALRGFFRIIGIQGSALLCNIIFIPHLLRLKNIELIYQRYSLLNLTGIILAWWYRVPLMLEFNGSEVWVNKHWSAKKSKIIFLISWIERLNLDYADSIIVVSEPLKNSLIAQGINPEKILVNPNGVNTALYNPALLRDERQAIREKLTLQEKIVFGFVGTFHYWHGVELMMNAISKLTLHEPKAHFLLIGDGPLLEYCRQQAIAHCIEHAITFTGILPPAETKKYLAACDAFLCPTLPNKDGSEFFGSPTKLFEYLSLGKPIIASHIGQIADIICPALHIKTSSSINDKLGILFDPNDERQFVESLAYFSLLSKAERTAMGNLARQQAYKFDWEHHVTRIITFQGKQHDTQKISC